MIIQRFVNSDQAQGIPQSILQGIPLKAFPLRHSAQGIPLKAFPQVIPSQDIPPLQCHFVFPDLKNMISKHQFATNPIMTILDSPHFPPKVFNSPKYFPIYSNVFPRIFPSVIMIMNYQNSLCSVILFI